MHVDIKILQTLCRNVSDLLQADSGYASGADADGLHPSANKTAAQLDIERERDRHAFLYIVIVLIFYSFGIVVAIIMYLKREKEEIVEEKVYDDYMNFRADPGKRARYFRVQLMIDHLNKVQREQERRQNEEGRLCGEAGEQREQEGSQNEEGRLDGEAGEQREQEGRQNEQDRLDREAGEQREQEGRQNEQDRLDREAGEQREQEGSQNEEGRLDGEARGRPDVEDSPRSKRTSADPDAASLRSGSERGERQAGRPEQTGDETEMNQRVIQHCVLLEDTEERECSV